MDEEYYLHEPAFLRLFHLEFDQMLLNDNFRNSLEKLMLDNRILPEKYQLKFKEALESQKKVARDTKCMSGLNFVYYRALRSVRRSIQPFWKWLQDQLILYVDSIADSDLFVMLTRHPRMIPFEDNDGTDAEYFDHFFIRDDDAVQTLDLLTDVMNVEALVKALDEKNVDAYDFLLEHVVHRLRDIATMNDHQYAACELMRRIFFCNPGKVLDKQRSWYKDLLYAMSKNVHNATLLNIVDPNYATELAIYVAGLEVLDDVLCTENEADYFKEGEGVDGEFIPQPVDNIISIYDYASENRGTELQLRDYQKELAQHAREGMNTVICAPTGAGKTIVAIDIILEHLKKKMNLATGLTSEARVAFLVPTVPLVDQQSRQLRTYLPATYKVHGFHGADSETIERRAEKMLESHVIVCTPQLLLNMLKSVKRREKIYLEYFTLMVIDECHHCDKNHPYEGLMREVRSLNDRRGRSYCPQIVGLTASLGVGGNNEYNPEKTADHMLKLCARLMADQISSIRTQNSLKQLHEYVNPPIDKVERVSPPEVDPFRDAVCDIIQEIIDKMAPSIQNAISYVERLKEFKIPSGRDPNLANNIQRIIESLGDWNDDGHKQRVATGVAHLRVFIHAINVNDLLPSYFSFAYITDEKYSKMAELRDSHGFYEIYEHHKPVLQHNATVDTGTEKPIVNRLVTLIRDEYASNPGTRTLIFVETRQVAIYLSQMLLYSTALKNAKFDSNSIRFLTSSNQSASSGGMSNSDQKRILEGFAKGLTYPWKLLLGVVKLLVVTSVAEEGLDISSCNLIIKYNTVGSERTMIQRRGRARARSSKAVLFALGDAAEQREIRNVTREHLMHQCLQHLQAHSEIQLRDKIYETAQKMRADEMITNTERENRARILADNEYDIVCSNCRKRICSSRDIRCADTYYVCVEKAIWRNVTVGRSDKPTSDEYVSRCGLMNCANCRHQVGSVIRYLDAAFLPALNGNLIRPQAKRAANTIWDGTTVISWKKMATDLFVIPNLTQNCLIRMATGLQEIGQAGDYEAMMEQSRLAVKLKCEAIKRKKMRRARYALAEYGEMAFEQNDDDD